jgi:hypothetical protein
MNPAILKLREDNIRKAEQQAKVEMHSQSVQTVQQLESTMVQAFNSLVKYLDNKITKTEVVNQLKEIGTPDAFKVMSAVNDMHSSLKKLKNTDLSEVTNLMRGVLDQVSQLPKELPELPEQRESVAISNLSTLEDKFDGLESAISALADKELPTPQVKVDAPNVNVEAPIATDTSKIEKKLDKSNEYLEEISKIRGGGGGGGSGTSFKDSSGALQYVELQDGGIPTVDVSYATRIDDSADPIIYIGKAPISSATSASVWQIAKLDTSSGLIKTWAGTAGFTQVWDDRVSLSYS